MRELRLTTTANDAGQRLDRVLSLAAPELSRAALQKAVQAGHCQIDGLAETRANAKIRAGQNIVLSLPETSTTLQAEEGHLELLWQDEHMVVCNKPAGLTVHPCPSCPEQTLVQRLLGRFPQLGKIEGQRPGIVHACRLLLPLPQPKPEQHLQYGATAILHHPAHGQCPITLGPGVPHHQQLQAPSRRNGCGQQTGQGQFTQSVQCQCQR